MPKLDATLTKKIHLGGQETLKFWKFLSRFGLYLFLVALFALAFATQQNAAVVFWLLPALAAFVITIMVRSIIRRRRPKFADSDYEPLVPSYSFPSAHASVAFALATTLSIVALDLVSSIAAFIIILCLMVWASLIALSRIMVGVHYLFDIIAGALLGIIISILLVVI